MSEEVAADPAPIALAEPRFSLDEALFVASVPETSLRNWMGRGLLDIGKHARKVGWRFSLLDLVQLRVMADLCVLLRLPPSEAARVAQVAARLAWNSTWHERPRLNLLLAHDEAGGLHAGWADIEHPGCYAPPRFDDTAAASLRRAHLVLPIHALLCDVHARAAAAEANRDA